MNSLNRLNKTNLGKKLDSVETILQEIKPECTSITLFMRHKHTNTKKHEIWKIMAILFENIERSHLKLAAFFNTKFLI